MIFTVENEYALLELLARLAQEQTQELAEEAQGDPPRSGSEDAEERPRGRDLEDFEGDDAYAQEVCVPRFGPI